MYKYLVHIFKRPVCSLWVEQIDHWRDHKAEDREHYGIVSSTFET